MLLQKKAKKDDRVIAVLPREEEVAKVMLVLDIRYSKDIQCQYRAGVAVLGIRHSTGSAGRG